MVTFTDFGPSIVILHIHATNLRRRLPLPLHRWKRNHWFGESCDTPHTILHSAAGEWANNNARPVFHIRCNAYYYHFRCYFRFSCYRYGWYLRRIRCKFSTVVGRTCQTLAWAVWSTLMGSAILDDRGCSIRPCVRAFEENLLITSPTSHFTQLHFKRLYQQLSCIFSFRNRTFCQLFIFYRKCSVIATTRIDRRIGWSARRMELVDQWRLGFGGVSWLNAHDARACITMEQNKNNDAS